MIRRRNLFWIVLAGLLGYGLYHLKHEVQALEDELFRLNRQILAEQEAIHVLRAEWSYINQPQRLQSLVARHLDLQLTTPAQLGSLANLPARPAEAPTPATADSSPVVPAPAAPRPNAPNPKAANLKASIVSVVPVNPGRPAPRPQGTASRTSFDTPKLVTPGVR